MEMKRNRRKGNIVERTLQLQRFGGLAVAACRDNYYLLTQKWLRRKESNISISSFFLHNTLESTTLPLLCVPLCVCWSLRLLVFSILFGSESVCDCVSVTMTPKLCTSSDWNSLTSCICFWLLHRMSECLAFRFLVPPLPCFRFGCSAVRVPGYPSPFLYLSAAVDYVDNVKNYQRSRLFPKKANDKFASIFYFVFGTNELCLLRHFRFIFSLEWKLKQNIVLWSVLEIHGFAATVV